MRELRLRENVTSPRSTSELHGLSRDLNLGLTSRSTKNLKMGIPEHVGHGNLLTPSLGSKMKSTDYSQVKPQ